MNNCSENVKFYANPIAEYISTRIGCQRFYGAPLLQVVDKILADWDGSENQMISDIHVKSFLTRRWVIIEESYRVALEELFLHLQALPGKSIRRGGALTAATRNFMIGGDRKGP